MMDSAPAGGPQSGMARKRKSPEDYDPYAVECGERLLKFRERALAFFNQKLFAESIGVLPQSLSDYEIGKTLVPPRVLLRIEKEHGAAGLIQYVFSGDMIGLRGAHKDKLTDPRLHVEHT